MKTQLEKASQYEINRLSSMTPAQIEQMPEEREKEEEIVQQGGQFFRKIPIIEEGRLKNGMKIQIGISDALDPDTFNPLDKVMLFNRNGKYY
jgi:hypothetical protein